MKICSKCKAEKALDEFHKRTARTTRGAGLASACKKCDAEYNAKWYAENRERKREYNAKWYAENRERKHEWDANYRASLRGRITGMRAYRNRKAERFKERIHASLQS